MIKDTGTGVTKHATTLGRFEKVFVFMVDPNSLPGASLYSFFIACAAFTSCFILFLQTLAGPNHHNFEPEYPKLPNVSGYYDADLVFTIIFAPELLVRLVIWPSMWREHEYLTERRLKPFLRDFFQLARCRCHRPILHRPHLRTPTKGNVASRCFAVMIIMSGTLFLSMPLAIIETGFDSAWKQHAESVKKLQQLQAGCLWQGTIMSWLLSLAR
ncbi:uncharacterized protein PITG_09166 [Phytophthora infestans T30-4]|uniref:Ion transport domain-containing protein n=2 Tax=Phytophthora infestans TaxID=4787 RepID=D0NBU9_PHYIT|nr:uncharacterized protein PITG_09166 [Phytophthora infestans T30-4]EEY55254.1 conserved hypothetical protein [Phytophthora infestans T30-4]KAF4031005.1 hypothetical protein GN244_ATG17097 [Phytophthora infestans]KAF4134834.1 hypothetical protein GN958_ATG16090 [Phytophthora infestans]|eukprot:XP_002903478.1 conserved hypothetical protein [Phytophthora infestans T30-4]